MRSTKKSMRGRRRGDSRSERSTKRSNASGTHKPPLVGADSAWLGIAAAIVTMVAIVVLVAADSFGY